MFCRDDINEPDGVFCHSAAAVLSETQLMTFLCGIGFARAVVLSDCQLNTVWRKVTFHHSDPMLQQMLVTAFNLEDLRVFFKSGFDVLCTDFQCIELPPEVRSQLELPVAVIQRTEDLDHYDKLLIFTDGSSQPAMRTHCPQYADELGHPDTWSMLLVIGERFDSEHQSSLVLLGWMADPVRYDPGGSAWRISLIGAGVLETFDQSFSAHGVLH